MKQLQARRVIRAIVQSLLFLCFFEGVHSVAIAQEEDGSHYFCDTRLADDYISHKLAGSYTAKITPTAVGSVYGSGIYPGESEAQVQITWDASRETLLIGFPVPGQRTPLVNVSHQIPDPHQWGGKDRDALDNTALSFDDIEILLNCPIRKLTRFSANTSYQGSVHSLRLVWVSEDPVTLYGTWNWSSYDGTITGVNSNIVLTKP